jgi:DNA-binding transcriptional MocR family regulator
MLPRAVTGRVAYTPGTAFFYDGTGADHLRLSFCYPDEATIREGVRRLAAVISAERESVEIFGTTPQLDDVTDVDVPGPDIA